MAAPAAATPPEFSFAWMLARTLIVILILIPLIYALTRLYAQRTFGPPGRRLRVLEAVALGAQRHVFVVAAGKRRFLLASAPQQVSLIAELSEEEWPLPEGGDGSLSSFARTLADRLRSGGEPPQGGSAP